MAEEKRADLERLLERRLLTGDAARPEAVALNAATLFELDDVVDPAETRELIARTLAAAGPPERSGRFVDSW